MMLIADLHVHSKYSRACSARLSLPENARMCVRKGVNLLGTGDCLHPAWLAELESALTESEPGLYRLNSGEYPQMRFAITTEVSQIYRRDGATRRVHNLLFFPSLESARRVQAWLMAKGFNVASDGRPILGMDSEVLYREVKNIDPAIVLVPAHAWTPWFSVFGSKSGFDTLQGCFGEMTPEVFAIETGLSSDPLMNRALSALDDIALISSSDAHGPENFGREATRFDIPDAELSFAAVMDALRSRDPQRLLGTIEFFPEEGKYHADGHAACKFFCSPEQTRAHEGRCPHCGTQMTVGVLARVLQLADRPLPLTLAPAFAPFRSIVPLPQIVAESLGLASPASKRVAALVDRLVEQFGNELGIVLDVPLPDINAVGGDTLAEAVRRVRTGEMRITPGYDGVYGVVKIFPQKTPRGAVQTNLF